MDVDLSQADQRLHFPYGIVEPDGNSAGDDGMADIQLVCSGEGCYGLDISVIEPVPEIEDESKRSGQFCGILQSVQLVLALGSRGSIGIRSRVEFHCLYSELLTASDLSFVRINEQTHNDASVEQSGAAFGNTLVMRNDVESPFSSNLFPAFRYQSDLIGNHLQGEIADFRADRHFQIQSCGDHLAQDPDIPILNMSTILPQVNRDSVGPCTFCNYSSMHWIRFTAAPSLPQGGNVVDVYSKQRHVHCSGDCAGQQNSETHSDTADTHCLYLRLSLAAMRVCGNAAWLFREKFLNLC